MTPRATYRFQLNKNFPFDRAAELAPYLRRLGVSHVYASPIMTAREGSVHGYDVVDPARVNPELGGDEGFARLAATLTANGLRLIVDIVPNHMAAGSRNRWWMDVLENGPSSAYAPFFDVAWNPSPGAGVEDKIILPTLGDHYGSVLERGELQLSHDEDGLAVNYWETRLPLDPKTYAAVLAHAAEHLDEGSPEWRELEALLTRIEALPPRNDTSADALTARRCGVAEIKQRLSQLNAAQPAIRARIDASIAAFNGTPGDAHSFDLLDALLGEQAYRLAYWRVASQEINYRRFFDVAELISLRIGREDVFDAVHERILEMAAAGQVDGLRVDHIDGLYDPTGYAQRLRERLTTHGRDSSYLVVEKILTGAESLPDDWPVDGTTGYDFLIDVNGVFVDPVGISTLDAAYTRFTGLTDPFAQVVFDAKRQVMAELFGGEITGLARRLDALTEHDRYGRDLTIRELGQAVSQLIAAFPVYRTYIRSDAVSPRDRATIDDAFQAALARTPYNRRALEFVRRVLTLDLPTSASNEQREDWLRFVMRFQQYTSPIMAKGHEDTALYRYNRLISLNDVGGEPGRPGIAPAEFHRRNAHRQTRWPATMNTTSTHDTKRSEDVRARINVISELADAWAARVDAWHVANERAKSVVHDRIVPDGNAEWFMYQTLAGAWPLEDDGRDTFRERIQDYLVKAFREAKVHTSWTRPDADYEAAIAAFVATILTPADDEHPNPFLDDFADVRQRIAYYGALNSLAQTLLKITVPGVPDFYQGTELWDFSLVDPDNRRPVDYARRAAALDAMSTRGGNEEEARELLEHWQDGRVKLMVTSAALAARAEHVELFTWGGYLPLETLGARAAHACAFARRHADAWALVVTPRLMARLALIREQEAHPDNATRDDARLPACAAPLGAASWGDTRLALPEGAPDRWRDAFTNATLDAADGELPLADIFATFPVALLLPA